MPDKLKLPPGATLVDAMKLPPGAVMVDDQPVPAGPDLSAPANNTEGLYEMSGPGGVKQVPFSKVKDALSAGYSMKHPLLMKYRDDFRATQPSWFQTATEPVVAREGKLTAPEAFQDAFGDAPTNVLKRAARFFVGVAQMPAQLTSIVQKLSSSDPKVSSEAEGELLELHPGAQADNRIKEAVADWRKSPNVATENVLGDALGIYLTGKTVEGVSKVPGAIADTTRHVAESAAGVSPREAAALVKKTQAKNTRIEDINAKRTETDTARARDIAAHNAETLRAAKVKADADRAAQLRDYLRKKQTVNEANSARQSIADRKVALERGVEHLDPELKTELETTRDAVNAEANGKYNDLNSVLKDEKAAPYQAKDEDGHIVGEPETITQHLYDVASEPLRGTETESSIVKSLGKRVENGELDLTYNDLQGYREEVGRKFRSGTLPPGEYAAYKALMPEIDNAMQEIAERRGMGRAQTEARNFYRSYAQTFLDKKSPVRKALLSPERGGVVKALIGKDQSGIESIAQFNPELSRRLNTVRGHAEEASSLHPSSTPPKPAPTLPPKPEFIPPKIKPVPEPRAPLAKKTVGPDEIQAAKEAGLRRNAAMIRHRGTSIAIYVTGYRSLAAIARAAMGDAHALAQLPADVGEGVGVVGGAHAVASMLESPRAIELLTKPNARDIAQIPPELRSGLKPVIEQAQKHGIKVSPLLIAAVMGDAAEGPQTKRLRELRDKLHTQP